METTLTDVETPEERKSNKVPYSLPPERLKRHLEETDNWEDLGD